MCPGNAPFQPASLNAQSLICIKAGIVCKVLIYGKVEARLLGKTLFPNPLRQFIQDQFQIFVGKRFCIFHIYTWQKDGKNCKEKRYQQLSSEIA